MSTLLEEIDTLLEFNIIDNANKIANAGKALKTHAAIPTAITNKFNPRTLDNMKTAYGHIKDSNLMGEKATKFASNIATHIKDSKIFDSNNMAKHIQGAINLSRS